MTLEFFGIFSKKYTHIKFHENPFSKGAWGGVVVKALRYKSEGPGTIPNVSGVFSVASDSSKCPGVDSASKNEYQVNPGG
jgi:hypothetical protein